MLLLVKLKSFDRKRFGEICRREVTVPGITIMRDIAIAKSEFVPGEKAVTKLQDFQNDDVLFGYCCLPEVGLWSTFCSTLLPCLRCACVGACICVCVCVCAHAC